MEVLHDVRPDHPWTQFVINNLRQHDIDECNLLQPGTDPRQAVLFSLSVSVETWQFIGSRGDSVAVGGIAPFDGRPGMAIWLVGSTAAEQPRNRYGLIKLGQSIVAASADKYGAVSNYCSSDPQQLAAMRLLGFKVYNTDVSHIRYIECVS